MRTPAPSLPSAATLALPSDPTRPAGAEDLHRGPRHAAKTHRLIRFSRGLDLGVGPFSFGKITAGKEN